MPKEDKEIGNFIEALLTSLECLAGIETVWTFCESDKCIPEKKQKLLYQEVEGDLKDFEEKTGFTARALLKKWNKANHGPQA